MNPPDPIKHSIVEWCFADFGPKWEIEELCRVSRDLGCDSVELVDPSKWPVLKEYGMVCAIAPVSTGDAETPPFVRGFNNPIHREMVVQATKDAIDACAANEFPNVISFTGFDFRDPDNPDQGRLSLEEGAKNCVDGYKQVVDYAEKNDVTICLEVLNTRDKTSQDHGHPNYQGDHIDYCASIINSVGSPNLKLLLDFYHVQIMDGDLINRVREYAEIIGHVHTGGVPGRNEIGDEQEINYPAVIHALRATGYEGFIGHEFMPVGDPAEAIHEALVRCSI